MRTLVFILLCMAAACAFANDPDPRGGFFTVTSGKVRQPDGSFRNLAGMRIPYFVEPMNKTKWKGYRPSNFSFGGNEDVLQKIYMNDKPANYFGGWLEGPMPSALDDIQTTGLAVGNAWKQLTVGIHIPRRELVWYIFAAYDTYLGDAGPGNSAFSNILIDSFGGPFWDVILNPGIFPEVPGDYMVTFNIASTGITQADTQIYFWQQFHYDNYNGPWAEDWAMFFSGNGAPQIGSSQDMFWYDSDPMDMTYAYEEVDLFNQEGQTGNEANFAMAIDVDASSTASDLPSAEAQVLAGTVESGNNLSTWSSNNQHFVITRQNTAGDFLWPIKAVFKTFAPSGNIQSLQITVESSTDVPGQTQRIALFNYTLGTWVTVNTSSTSTTDQTINQVIGINPQQYVQPGTFEMKMMVQARPNTSDPAVWREKIDWIKWRVTTP